MGKLLLILLVAAACATTGPGVANPEPERTGKQLYETSCQRCHALYMPRSHSVSEWRFYVRKDGRKARLTREQKVLVLGYLTQKVRGFLALTQRAS